MKDIFIIQFILLVLLISLISCEKNQDSNNFIIMGDVDNLIVKHYNTFIRINEAPYTYPEISEYYIDIDNDSIKDIMIRVSGYGSSHFGTKVTTNINLLHDNIGFFARKIVDTIYLVEENFFYATDNDMNVSYVQERVYGNIKTKPTDSIVHIKSTVSDTISGLRECDTIWNTSVFLNENITPHPTSQHVYCCDTLSVINDTIYVRQDVFNYHNQNNISYGVDLYFGILLNDRLGFIKIKLHDYWKVELFYSTIQRKI